MCTSVMPALAPLRVCLYSLARPVSVNRRNSSPGPSSSPLAKLSPSSSTSTSRVPRWNLTSLPDGEEVTSSRALFRGNL